MERGFTAACGLRAAADLAACRGGFRTGPAPDCGRGRRRDCCDASSGLSGTYNLARVIAEECRDRIPVRVFDSLSGSLGQGLTVLQLAEDIRSGMGWEELTERRAPQLIAATTPFFSVDTLEVSAKRRPHRQSNGHRRSAAAHQAAADLCSGRTADLSGQGPGTARR